MTDVAMARWFVYAPLLIWAAVTTTITKGEDKTAASGSEVTASVKRDQLVRVICNATGKEIYQIQLNGSGKLLAKAEIDEAEEVKKKVESDGMAVHGFIDYHNGYGFLEVSFFECPAVKHKQSDFECKVAANGQVDHQGSLVFQEVDVFNCGLRREAPADDVNDIVIIEKNGAHESFVGPSSTSAKEVKEGLKQFGGMKNNNAWQPVTVYRRRNSTLIVARPAKDFPNNDVTYICRVTWQNGTEENVTFGRSSHNEVVPQPPAGSMAKVADAQEDVKVSLEWLGYPVLGLLLIVFIGLYVRERRLRCNARRQNEQESEGGGNLLRMNDLENP